MSIEIKQMVIKSTLVNNHSAQERSEQAAIDIEQLREMLMEECRELIAESLNEMQER